jgi:hypothetical protein
MKETDLMRLIQTETAKQGTRLFRNNVALSYQGEVFKPKCTMNISVGPQDIVIRNARPIKSGLGVGTSDLIGWTPTIITEKFLNKSLAIFTAVEVKSAQGKLTIEQSNFLRVVDAAGGIAICAKSLDDVGRIINGANQFSTGSPIITKPHY